MGQPVRSVQRRVDESEILSQCLHAIERKQLTLEECVKRYPEFTELGELLATANAVREIPRPVMSAAARATLEHQALAKFQTLAIKSPQAAQRLLWRRVSRLAMAFSIILAIIFGSSSGLVKAASDTVPGDSLYFIKQIGEEVQITFTMSKDLPDVLLQMAQTRLHELYILQSRDQFLSQDVVINTFQSLDAALKIQNDAATREQLLQEATAIFDEAQTDGKVNADLVMTDLTILAGVSPTNPATISAKFVTSTPTLTATDTDTFTPTTTLTASVTLTATPPETETPEDTATPTDVPPTDTATPTDTDAPTTTLTPTDIPEPTDTDTPEPTVTPIPTDAGSPTPSLKPTHKPTHIPPTNSNAGGNGGGNGNGNGGGGGNGGGNGNGNGGGHGKP